MSKSSIPQPVMHLCRTRAGERGETQALGWAVPQGGPETLANRQPPVEPTLYHRGSPTGRVIPRPSRRGWTGPLPRLRVPPLVSASYHGEVTHPWAAVGESHDMT